MSMGAMPCSASACMCSGLARIARMPPVIFGCMVFTRPSSISGKPVTSETSFTGDAGFANQARRAAGGDQLGAQRGKCAGKFDDVRSCR